MVINGFQKMTLLDYPEHVACTVFTAGCNFRCPFCHNALLVTDIRPEDSMHPDEVLAYLAKRTGILEGVAITGGEPLLQPDLEDFIKKIRSLGYPVKLDTNGSDPAKLARVVEQGLVDYVAMDVKNRPEKYAETIGIRNYDPAPVMESIDFLMTTDKLPAYEFRTTVVREFHTVDDIIALSQRIAGAKKYFLQNFVDSGTLIGSGMHAVTPGTLREMAAAAREFCPSSDVRGI